MISLVIFLNGVYDILCSLCILKLIKIPFLGNYYNLDNIHLSIIKDYNPMYERLLGHWVLTCGLIRISSDYKLISYSYIIEAVYFLSEYFHNNIHFINGLFVVTTSVILGYISYKN